MTRMSDEEFSLRFDAVALGGWAKQLQTEAIRARAREARLEAALVKAGEAAIQTGAVKVAHIIAAALEEAA